jgi:metal-sulfur cluster biosynthetic enzyme
MHPDRVAAVMDRLVHVTDPELDEPVTELGFVTGVAVSGEGEVTVDFRLPTYWCAANFAFMMADDMRREVAVLPWVRAVRPRLSEHMYADQINDGVARGLSFGETFGDAADGDLDALRRTFLLKSFQRRQEALLRHLMQARPSAEALATLTLGCLARLPLDDAAARLHARYLERRALVGPAAPDDLAFVDTDGAALAAGDLPGYLRSLRRVGSSAEFNGALCSSLLAARFGEEAAADGAPGLRHFIREAALAQDPARRTA